MMLKQHMSIDVLFHWREWLWNELLPLIVIGAVAVDCEGSCCPWFLRELLPGIFMGVVVFDWYRSCCPWLWRIAALLNDCRFTASLCSYSLICLLTFYFLVPVIEQWATRILRDHTRSSPLHTGLQVSITAPIPHLREPTIPQPDSTSLISNSHNKLLCKIRIKFLLTILIDCEMILTSIVIDNLIWLSGLRESTREKACAPFNVERRAGCRVLLDAILYIFVRYVR